VLSHELVPKHYIVSEDERQKVIEKYGIMKMSQFPTIRVTDPAVQAVDGKIGDLIKIVRKSNIAKETIYFRLVAE
jgi:DNA-directed RNA polymerase subunit H (RpoH/RPB5)